MDRAWWVEQIEDQSIGEANSLSVVEPYYFGNLPNRDKIQLPIAQSDLLVKNTEKSEIKKYTI